MSIIPDTSGFQREDDDLWVDPATGDRMSVHFFDLVPNLPAGLKDLERLRRELTLQTAEVGGLVEAFVVTIDNTAALLQIVKLPLPDRPGQVFIASITVPKATSSAVLKLIAIEGPMTGIRESMVLADVISETGNPDAFYSPHPFAPDSTPKLPWHRADDPRFDERTPDHPLSRVRRWLRHVIATTRLDPEFAALPEFGSPVSVSIGLPIGPFLPLWTNQTLTFWRMDDADAVRAQLGRGTADRRPISGTDESWEAGWLHPADGLVALSPKTPPVKVTPVSDETAYTSITAEEIVAAFDWIGALSVIVGDRPEMLLVTTKAHDDGDKWVLMCLQASETSPTPYFIIETSPVPTGAEFWDTLPPMPNPNKAGYSHHRDADEASLHSRLTMWAVQTWDLHPFRLILAYKPNEALPKPTT
jgi:hypothetical protein